MRLLPTPTNGLPLRVKRRYFVISVLSKQRCRSPGTLKRSFASSLANQATAIRVDRRPAKTIIRPFPAFRLTGVDEFVTPARPENVRFVSTIADQLTRYYEKPLAMTVLSMIYLFHI